MESTNNNSDIIDKLKESVIAKLDELDSSKKRDATLIDYIIVMVVNQKSKFEMKHNLSLFLGKIVDEFVNWLFDYLATTNELKVKTTSPVVAAPNPATTSTSNSSRAAKISLKSASNPKESEKSKKGEPVDDSKTNSTTNGHSKSEEGTNKSESKKSTSKRKLKSAVSVSSSDDKDTETATTPVTTSNSTADATTIISTTNTKNSGKAKKHPVTESSEQSYSASRKRTLSNSTNNNDNNNDGSAKKSKQNAEAKKNSNDDDVDMLNGDDASKENAETKFLITLDGAKDMFKGRDNDGLLLDEDFDPELMNEDLSNFSNNTKNNYGSPTKNNHHYQNGVDVSMAAIKENNGGNRQSTERCKYWPACLNGDQCEFFHPVTKCNNFPYCRFGDKCLYIHPTCKFDSYCTRKDCNYQHTAKVRGPPMHQMYPSAMVHPSMMMYGGPGMLPVGMGMGTPNVTCKFFPNCMKPACEFFHPKICHYGPACTSFNCPFVHLPSQAAAAIASAPAASVAATAAPHHTSKFKWSSSKKGAVVAIDES